MNLAINTLNILKLIWLNEKQYKATLGPIKTVPIKNLHETQEKPGAPHCRVIIDLSFPTGHSFNAGVGPDSYLGLKFMLTLHTIDKITNKLAKLYLED